MFRAIENVVVRRVDQPLKPGSSIDHRPIVPRRPLLERLPVPWVEPVTGSGGGGLCGCVTRSHSYTSRCVVTKCGARTRGRRRRLAIQYGTVDGSPMCALRDEAEVSHTGTADGWQLKAPRLCRFAVSRRQPGPKRSETRFRGRWP